MTKFILVGGYPRKAADGGRALAEEMAQGFDDPIKLLVCYFARPRLQWELNMVEDRLFFGGHLSNRRVDFQIAHKAQRTRRRNMYRFIIPSHAVFVS